MAHPLFCTDGHILQWIQQGFPLGTPEFGSSWMKHTDVCRYAYTHTHTHTHLTLTRCTHVYVHIHIWHVCVLVNLWACLLFVSICLNACVYHDWFIMCKPMCIVYVSVCVCYTYAMMRVNVYVCGVVRLCVYTCVCACCASLSMLPNLFQSPQPIAQVCFTPSNTCSAGTITAQIWYTHSDFPPHCPAIV